MNPNVDKQRPLNREHDKRSAKKNRRHQEVTDTFETLHDSKELLVKSYYRPFCKQEKKIRDFYII